MLSLMANDVIHSAQYCKNKCRNSGLNKDISLHLSHLKVALDETPADIAILEKH